MNTITVIGPPVYAMGASDPPCGDTHYDHWKMYCSCYHSPEEDAELLRLFGASG